MYANKRYLSESSSEDVDDPDGVSDSNENDHDNNVNGGYTASYKRPRISRDSQSTEDEQDLDAAAASLDRAIDTSSSSDTEQLELGHGPSWGSTFQASQQPVAPQAASLNKPGQYSSAAERMMAMMGYKSGTGLGKKAQGRVEPVGISKQRGRRGLGLVLKGLETDDTIEWNADDERVEVEEKVSWMEPHSLPVPSTETLSSWMFEDDRKIDISDEDRYCDKEALSSVLSAKTVFDKLEGDELMKARTRSNPFETIRGAFFLNRAAMKMANLDAICGFMFSKPVDDTGKPMVTSNDPLYFADVCAGPGGFSEYILWRKKWRSKGFGFTLRNTGHDFKLDDFYAGPPESFEPHYGVKGADGDGNVFDSENIEAFRSFVMENTRGKGVHFMMADGGFSVEGQENIQEILSKQLYLCQCLVALSIIREKGHFVCKLFDLFTPFSVGLVYLMYRSFQQIAIHKPNTSRPANSERYIICKWKRPDCENIRNYMMEINNRINELGFSMGGTTRSQVDILSIVPDPIMQRDSPEFLEYMRESNNNIADDQVVGLTKIAAFCKNQNLHEFRQAEIRSQSLEFWQIPDETRKKPMMEKPQNAAIRLLHNQSSMLMHNETILKNAQSLEDQIKSVYDWKAVVLGAPNDKQSERSFILGLGRTKVYMLEKNSNFWRRLDELVKFELSPNTLLYGEVVTEYRGERHSQRKVKNVHIIDAFVLGGEDISQKHFMERHNLLKLFLQNMNKNSRNDYVKLRLKEVYKLDDLNKMYNGCDLKILKGRSAPSLCHELSNDIESDGIARYFQPTGIMFYKTVKEPYMMALSRSQNKKYWFNTMTRGSFFEMPKDSVAGSGDCHGRRLTWLWDSNTGIHPGLGSPTRPSEISRQVVDKFVSRKLK